MLIRLLKISINLIVLPLFLYLIYFYREVIINETISIIYLGDIIKAGLENQFIGNYLSFIFALTIVGIWVPFFTANQRVLGFTYYLPALLPALGLIGTFIGIFAGLSEFDPGNIDESLPILLAGLKIAFTTSIFGMVGSAMVKIASFFHPDNTSKDEITENDFFKLFNAQKESLVEINKGIKNLEVKFEDFANKIGESTVEQLIKAIEEVIRDFNSKVEEQFGENFKKFNEGLEKLLEWQNNYVGEVEATKKAIDTSNNLLDRHEKNLEKTYAQLEKIPEVLQPIQQVLNIIKEERTQIEAGLKSLQELRNNASQSIPELTQKISILSDSLSNNITQVSERLNKLDEEMTTELQKSLELLGAHLGSLSEQLVKDYQPLVNDLRSLIEISKNVKK